jgi:hypothetical protein
VPPVETLTSQPESIGNILHGKSFRWGQHLDNLNPLDEMQINLVLRLDANGSEFFMESHSGG